MRLPVAAALVVLAAAPALGGPRRPPPPPPPPPPESAPARTFDIPPLPPEPPEEPFLAEARDKLRKLRTREALTSARRAHARVHDEESLRLLVAIYTATGQRTLARIHAARLERLEHERARAAAISAAALDGGVAAPPTDPVQPTPGTDAGVVAPTGTAYVDATRLKLRAAPDRASAAVTELFLNEAVTITAVEGDWARVVPAPGTRYRKGVFSTGYVGREYLGSLPLALDDLVAEADAAEAVNNAPVAMRALERAAALKPGDKALLRRLVVAATNARQYPLAVGTALAVSPWKRAATDDVVAPHLDVDPGFRQDAASYRRLLADVARTRKTTRLCEAPELLDSLADRTVAAVGDFAPAEKGEDWDVRAEVADLCADIPGIRVTWTEDAIVRRLDYEAMATALPGVPAARALEAAGAILRDPLPVHVRATSESTTCTSLVELAPRVRELNEHWQALPTCLRGRLGERLKDAISAVLESRCLCDTAEDADVAGRAVAASLRQIADLDGPALATPVEQQARRSDVTFSCTGN